MLENKEWLEDRKEHGIVDAADNAFNDFYSKSINLLYHMINILKKILKSSLLLRIDKRKKISREKYLQAFDWTTNQ